MFRFLSSLLPTLRLKSPSNMCGSRFGSIPRPSSVTRKTAFSPSRDMSSVIFVMPSACIAAFSNRFIITCLISMPSMGTSSSSSGICVSTFTFGKCFLNCVSADAATSSTTSLSFAMFAPPSGASIRVTISRFSTNLISHCESSSIWLSSLFFSCSLSVSPPSFSTLHAPLMAVSGVLRSCETARSRLLRVRSRSASIFNCSCSFILVVSVPVIMAADSMLSIAIGYPVNVKLSW